MPSDRERGQGTVEWIGLISLVALVVVALGALAGVTIPGTALARAIGGRLLCALELEGDCGAPGASDLVLAYDVSIGQGEPIVLLRDAERVRSTAYRGLLAGLQYSRRLRESLARAAHTLKGAASNFGAHGVVKLTACLEEIGQAEQLSEARTICAALEAEVERLNAALSALVDKGRVAAWG